MSLLRVLLTDPFDVNRADDWALFDGSGARVARGHGAPATWPHAARREGIIAASWVRLIALKLPPLPAPRVVAAARFALEDRLAAPLEDHQVAVSPQHADGTVVATVIGADVVNAIEMHPAGFSRVLAEPALAPDSHAWTWYCSAGTHGFVRTPDGSSFAVEMPDTHHVPDELLAALRSARGASADAVVAVASNIDDHRLAQFANDLRRPVQKLAAWRWDDAPPVQFAGASDLLATVDAPSDASTRAARFKPLKPAVILLGLALVLQIGAMVAQWAYLRIEAWRIDRAFVALAHDAGIIDATNRESAANALAVRYAKARHRAGHDAPTDAMPLLARAAQPISALPGGTLRSASYAGGAWTVELGRVDATQLARLAQSLTDAGLAPLYATSATGTRLRFTLAQ